MRLIARDKWVVNLSSEDQRDLLRNKIRACIQVGGPFTFEIKPYKRKRSNPQNAYLWGVVYPLMAAGFRELGWQDYDEEMVHAKMKQAFCKKQIVNDKTGEIEFVEGSTTDYDTAQFNEYKDRVIQWASENLSVVIPDPY